MALSSPTAAKSMSIAGRAALGLVAAAATFVVAIVIPPLALVVAAVSVVKAVAMRRNQMPSAPLMAAVAAGCVTAAAVYAALAIANSQFDSSGSGHEVAPPPEIVHIR